MSYISKQPVKIRLRRKGKKAVGAGDVVARMTRALGIEPCEPCEERKQWLNRHLQFVGRE